VALPAPDDAPQDSEEEGASGEPAGSSVVEVSGSATGVEGPRADELPFTGAELVATAGIGLLALAAGFALRRAGVRRTLRPNRG
jgi:hypothetical protein